MSRQYVLLIEDNDDDIELTRRAFARNHILNELVVARDGAEASALLFSEDREQLLPQFILLDLKLPKISGLELLKEIRANPRTALIPTVILTSSKQDEDLIEGYRLGVNSYVRKPVDFEQFVEAVRQLGLYWLVLNEKPANGVTNSS